MAQPFMNQSWRDWIKENIDRNCTPMSIYDVLRKSGFGLGAIRMGMKDYAPKVLTTDSEGRDASGRTRRYDTLADCAVTRCEADGLEPFKHDKLQIYTWRNFMSDEECDKMVALTNSNLRKSTITTPKNAAGYDDSFRTSETCFLDQVKDDFVSEIDTRIARGLGISTKWSEPIQAQKYSVGQEFKAHTDYFEPGSDEYSRFCSQMGQRTWTFMIYLNEGCEGGHTKFKHLNNAFAPTKGMAVIWNSMTRKGDPNPYSLHHGMKVQDGEKFVITKWFRDKGPGPMLWDDANAMSATTAQPASEASA